MHDLKKNDLPARSRTAWLVALGLALPCAVWAQPAPPDAPAATEAERRVDINEYIVRGNTVLDALVIEKAVTPFLGPQRTMKDIESARDALLAAYQEGGYQSVFVDLPEQQVTEGIVFLQVSETKIGRVRVVGAQYNSPVEVRDQVPALKEGVVPDFNKAQLELTALNKTGKRQVMPLVRQGAMPGTMDVDLKVDDKSPWRASIGLNNDRSADTRRLRATASIGNDNLWQMGHSASLSFFGTPEDLDQTNVWSGSYIAPLRDSNWSIEASGYVSDSSVATVGGTQVLGKGHSIGLKATYTVPDSGAWWHSLSAGVDLKDNDESLRLGSGGDKVPLKYAPITLSYSGFLQSEKAQQMYGLSLVAGTRSFLGYGSDETAFHYKRYLASASFMSLKANADMTQEFQNGMQLAVRLNGQLTDSPLVSSEQIAGGGLNSVRGYLSAEAIGDYGMVSTLEVRTRPLPFLGSNVENWRLYAFMDSALLRLRKPLPEQASKFPLMSVGVGTSMRIGPRISARMDLGYPMKDGPRTDKHDPTLNFSINANY